MPTPAEVERPNMTPMIDVVFQLLVFFLVTMKFKTTDMKLDAEMPTNAGINPSPATPPDPKVEVRLRRATPGEPTQLRVAGLALGDADSPASWDRLRAHLAQVRTRQALAGLDPHAVHGEVDASPAVTTGLVVRALDELRAADFRDVRFVGTPLLGPLHGR